MYVAVGSVAGRFFVLNAKNGMHIITVQVGKSQINTMKFSPGAGFFFNILNFCLFLCLFLIIKKVMSFIDDKKVCIRLLLSTNYADNAMLAVGCEDGHIHIFYVHDEGQIYRKNNIILRVSTAVRSLWEIYISSFCSLFVKESVECRNQLNFCCH
jgi:hypothetical protein